jgi:signal transduction histidine kinase
MAPSIVPVDETLQLLRDTLTVVNEAATPELALQLVVQRICEHTGWPLADVFLLESDGLLHAADAWYAADPVRHHWFRQLTEARSFAPGEGLCGEVLATGTALYVENVDEDPRHVRGWHEPSVRLHSYVGIPIMVGLDARGVMEFFTLADTAVDNTAVDDTLLPVLTDIGMHVGRTIERAVFVAEIQRLDQAQSRFVARAAHDLRTPVAALSIAAETFAERGNELSAEQHAVLVSSLVNGTERLKGLLAGLLKLTQMEQATPVVAVPVDLAAVVTRVVGALPPPDGASLTHRVPAGLIALAHGRSLEQVLANLINNAYRHGGSNVDIEAREHGQRVRLVVSDDGPGVDPDLEAMLFEPFAAKARRHRDDCGLGLAISQRLAECMGASLTYARPPETGTQFILELRTA